MKIIHKKRIIIGAVILILCIIGGVGYRIYYEKKQFEDYRLKFANAMTQTILEESLVDSMTNKISTTWHDAIFDDDNSEDFNDVIQELEQKYKDDKVISKLDTSMDTLQTNIKQLKNPPKKYEQAYPLLVKTFGNCEHLKEQAESPQGSLDSYNSDINSTVKSYKENLENLKLAMPNFNN